MSSFTVVVDVESYDVDQLLRDLQTSISGPSLNKFLEEDAAKFFRDDIESRFNEEGDPLSGFWPELSEATVNIKRDLPDLQGSPEQINIRTGELLAFVTGDYDTFVGADWAMMNVPGDPPDPITAIKLKTAQQGSDNNPIPNFGPTPARPVLAISEMMMGTLLGMLEAHIIQTLVGSISI